MRRARGKRNRGGECPSLTKKETSDTNLQSGGAA